MRLTDKIIEYFVVRPIYGVMLLARWIFLRDSWVGKFLHNCVYFVVGRVTTPQIEHKRKFVILKDIISGNRVGMQIQNHIYTSAPTYWKHFMKNVFAWRLVVGSIKRRIYYLFGHVVPSVIVISPNAPGEGCNLSCRGCYASGHPEAKMPIALFEKIIKEQEDLGIFTVFITGGEPLLYEGFWDITKKYRRTIFWTATNGTLITEKEVELMAETGNVVLNFNLDGFKKETDFMKGEGAFEKIREGIRKCQNAKLIYLATVTVSKHNFQTVASDKFIRMLVEYGFIGVNFSHYVPVGDDARPEWQISFEQSKRLDEWGKGIIKRFPIFVTIGRNGTDRVDGCFAANQYIHILPDGRIEPCPFAHWATGQNIKDSTILEIMDSAFIKTIREINKAGIPGLTPCRAQHIKSLQEGFEKLGAKSTIIKQEKEEEIYGERKRINAL